MKKPILFYSASKDLWECPRRFYYSYVLGLQPKGPPPSYLTYGAEVHDGVNVLISLLPSPEKVEKFLFYKKEDLEEKDLDYSLWLEHVKLTVDWLSENTKNVQYGIPVYEELPHCIWTGEADLLFEIEGELWLGEIKTTSGYGSSIARLYMEEPQVWSYLYFLRKKYPELKGFYLLALPKVKEPILHPERVLLQKWKLDQIEGYIDSTIKMYTFFHEEDFWPQNLNACFKYWGECPYFILCQYPQSSEEYQDLILQSFDKVDPLDHLKRRKEVREKWLRFL